LIRCALTNAFPAYELIVILAGSAEEFGFTARLAVVSAG
jgi:hypothetical protein